MKCEALGAHGCAIVSFACGLFIDNQWMQWIRKWGMTSTVLHGTEWQPPWQCNTVQEMRKIRGNRTMRVAVHGRQLPWMSVRKFVLLRSIRGRSQRPRSLRRRSTAARLLRLWVRIPPRAWMSVFCECCALSGTGLYAELITRPEESYRPWCVVVCDLGTSWMRRPWPPGGSRAKIKQTNKLKADIAFVQINDKGMLVIWGGGRKRS